jgi:hypothetical protein
VAAQRAFDLLQFGGAELAVGMGQFEEERAGRELDPAIGLGRAGRGSGILVENRAA